MAINYLLSFPAEFKTERRLGTEATVSSDGGTNDYRLALCYTLRVHWNNWYVRTYQPVTHLQETSSVFSGPFLLNHVTPGMILVVFFSTLTNTNMNN